MDIFSSDYYYLLKMTEKGLLFISVMLSQGKLKHGYSQDEYSADQKGTPSGQK